MSTAAQIVKIAGGTFDSAEHLYSTDKGKPVPSVTQMVDGLGFTDFENVPGETLERKRLLGDSVHFATKLDDEDALDWSTVHESTVGYILAYENFKVETGFVPDPAWTEKSMIHTLNGMPYGLTVDRVGTLRGVKHPCVVELKCTYRPEETWRIQTAGYEPPVREALGVYVGRVAVQLKDDGTFKLFLYENPRDRDIFVSCLALTHWKINEGIKWQKPKL